MSGNGCLKLSDSCDVCFCLNQVYGGKNMTSALFYKGEYNASLIKCQWFPGVVHFLLQIASIRNIASFPFVRLLLKWSGWKRIRSKFQLMYIMFVKNSWLFYWRNKNKNYKITKNVHNIFMHYILKCPLFIFVWQSGQI